MPDKLTDNEIKKALEDTLHRIKGAEHLIVPKLGVENLCNGLENALDLINRLQAKIDEAEDTIQFADKELKKAEAENETLRSVVKQNHLIRNNNKSPLSLLTNEIKSEAYKEFVERLKERKYLDETGWSHGEHPYVVEESDIDDVLEELVGEDK